MNLLLHVPPETEVKLLSHARAIGKDAEAVALDALRERFSDDEPSPMLPADEWRARFK